MEVLDDDHANAWSFDELVREGISLIPAYAPQWTNHNPSDPGITLVELCAHISEALAYRALRITPDAKLNFLRLLGEVPSSDALYGEPSAVVEEAIRERVQALSQAQCAVTPRDFEELAVDAAASHLGAHAVVRATCVPGADLRYALDMHGPAVEAPADVSIVLAPESELPDYELQQICQHVQEVLVPRCLLTTRVHVVAPMYLQVFVACRIALKPGVSLFEAVESADLALRQRFGPVEPHEPCADAWQFGRPLYLSEISAILDGSSGVDYVEDIIVQRMTTHDAVERVDSLVGIRIGVFSRLGVNSRLGGMASSSTRRLVRDHASEVEFVLLYPWELVRVQLARDAVQEIKDGSSAAGPGDRHGP